MPHSFLFILLLISINLIPNREEMKTIKGFQQTYVDVQQQLGQLSIAKLRLEQQLDSTLKASDELRNKIHALEIEIN